MLKFLTKYGWALLLIIALVVTACGPATPAAEEEQPSGETQAPGETGGESNLRVGIYAYMTNGIPFDEEVAACEESHPGLNIEVLPIPGEESAWQAITQKMQLEAQNEEASWDLVYGPTPFVEPGAMAALDLLEPLDSYFSEDFWNDIYTGVRKEIKYSGDGKTYHIPLWTDVFGLIYRPSMLEEAVGTSDPPTSWDEIKTYCEQIQSHYGEEISCFGADWSFAHRWFIPAMGTFSQNMFTEEGLINLDDPAALTTLQLMNDLYPYLPANSAEALGSSKAFQAGGVAMEIYWQAQYLRALQAGVPEDDMEIAPFPKGDYDNTLFWSGGIIVPKYSQNKEGAITFIKDCVLGEQSIKDIYNNYKIVPFKSAVQMLKDQDEFPSWAPPLIELLDVGQSIPSNRFFLTVEQPAFQEEAEKMLLADQSPEQTLANLKERFQAGMEE
jgi:ABC-type glycerol-3-phosphate transport system substrate-binding protein